MIRMRTLKYMRNPGPVIFLLIFTYCNAQSNKSNRDNEYEIVKTEEEWKEILTPEQYRVIRLKDTELAFTGKYHNSKEKGIYRCAACKNELYSSTTKFDSGSGWPSFYAPISRESIHLEKDYSYGMVREEVVCNRCGGHLGHVFNDGPEPTGLRHCVNSIALEFVPAEGK